MFNFFHSNSNHLPELFWHTDVHSHICPGIDDGARSPEMSIQLVRGMEELGFTHMIATPHVTDGSFPNTPLTIAESYLSLCEQCKKEGLRMQFSCSAEYRIDDLLFDMLRDKSIRPLPGGYILVENSWFQEPFNLEGLFFDLRNEHSLKPVMAHPERYRYYQRHRDRLEYLHNKGAFMQINILSLAGHYGKAEKNTAEWLLANNLVSFIGSDIHRTAHLEAIRNYFCSKDYRKLEAKSHLILNDTLLMAQSFQNTQP